MNALGDLAILIPARSGSKRVSDKNVKLLNGQSLLEIAIAKAVQLAGADNVFVSTDSKEYADLALSCGAQVPSLRPLDLATDSSTDIEWLLNCLTSWKIDSEYLSILRVTSPYVRGGSILDALKTLKAHDSFDSIRAVRTVAEHPGKMWRQTSSKEIIPLLPQISGLTPTHSRPTQSLETVYVQCGAFEIVRRDAVLRTETISGHRILGHVLCHPESLDINSPDDFLTAELFSREGLQTKA